MVERKSRREPRGKNGQCGRREEDRGRMEGGRGAAEEEKRKRAPKGMEATSREWSGAPPVVK